MSTLSQLLKSGSSRPADWQSNIFQSMTLTAPFSGQLVLRAMGAGGGGARHATNATGGYSASWGMKVLRINAGTSIVIAIGAGGAGKTATDGDGAAGGNTTVTINGVTYTAYGGPGGKANAAGPLPNGPAASANFDLFALSVPAGWGGAGVTTGGAGVDILRTLSNLTMSDSVSGSGGGGTGYGSVGSTGGGALPGGRSATGQIPAANAQGQAFDASSGEWGISFYGGSGGGSSSTGGPYHGGNGGGGGYGGRGGNGGGGSGSGSGGGDGGIGGGGGGGANASSGGNGGGGYVHLKLFAEGL